MPNSSSTGGYLPPAGTPAPTDNALDDIVQAAVVAITALDPTLVRPRWQPKPPKQPEPDVDWCAIGITDYSPDDSPYIAHEEGGLGQDRLIDHEDIEVLATFYGPNAAQVAARLRDGIKIPQNTEALGAQQIRFIACSPVRAVPALINQQWVRAFEMTLQLRRRFERVYAVESFLIADIHLQDDTTLDETITVPPDSTLEP